MEDEIGFYKENSHTPLFQYVPKIPLRGTPTPPTESSIKYSSSTKQSITEPMDFSTPETKKRDSTFYKSLYIHVEQPVGSMSISPSSRDIVLAT
jgi:hypothetical protein